MNEVLTHLPATEGLNEMVAELLKTEFGHLGQVITCDGRIIISLEKNDFEQRLGTILQQLYRVIDQRVPVRDQHLLLIIQDSGMRYKNDFKIWKTN